MKRILIIMISILASCDTGIPNFHSTAPAIVLWLAGQSNSNGEGEVGGAEGALPVELQGTHSDIMIMSNGITFQPLVYGVKNVGNQKDDFDNGRENGIGQEMKLGRLMADFYGRTIYIVKEALGGNSIADEWNPDTGASEGARWAEWDAKWTAAKAFFLANDLEYEVVALVWAQGEADSNNTDGPNYQTNLTNLISRFRGAENANDSTLKVITPLIRLDIPRNNPTDVRNAQIAVAAADANVYTVNVDDVPMVDAGIHHSMNGQITMSERIWNVINTLL